MKHDGLIGQNFKAFWSGSVAGGGLSVKLFLLDQTAWIHIAGEWVVRLLGISMVTLVSGIVSAVAADIYKHHIKEKFLKLLDRIFKNNKKSKQDGNQQDQNAA